MSDSETKTFTESALADLFTKFFNEFKEDGEYKYVLLIDSSIQEPHLVKIDFEDFTDEIKNVCKTEIKARLHFAIYRAISEVFQVRYGYAERTIFVQNNLFKFEIINFDRFDTVIFDDPKLIYLENDDDGKFAGEHKINNVAQQMQIENTFVTLRESDEILMYTGKIYDQLQAQSRIRERTEILIPDCTINYRNEVISKIKAQTYSDLKSFDADPNLITTDNGILTLDTMELSNHSPDYLSRVLIPTEFIAPKFEINDDTIFDDMEKNLNGTLFWQFLTSSFTVDGKFQKQNFETILEIMASPILKHQIDDKAFMFLGSGDNGKSIYLQYIQYLLGNDNGKSISLQDIADDKFMRADLDGKSFNIFPDLEKNEIKHTGKIKAICSGEKITVQKKYGHSFEMQTFAKMLFSCNRFPKVFDQSQGFFRRWLIIKWERNFEKDPARNEKLLEQLKERKEEAIKVFSCLVYLARKLHNTGKFTYSKEWKTIQKEWNENADPIDDFETNYIIDSENHKTKRETYQFYKRITLDKGETPLGMGQFSKAFEEYHDWDRIEMGESGSRGTERVWLNIDFKEPKQTTLNDTDQS